LRGIVTLHLIRRKEIAAQLAEMKINFDLVIIDEAHHLRNPNTLSNNVASVISENADAMLLLTATPLHLGNQDLFHLLHILSPGEFDNLEAFRQRIQPNMFINHVSELLKRGEYQSAYQFLLNLRQARC
jgi:SNF2 family DNA or RNA helicase